MDTKKAIGGSDVCETCDAHCQEIERLHEKIKKLEAHAVSVAKPCNCGECIALREGLAR